MVSTRRSQPDNKCFKIGDRCEVIHNGSLAECILLGPVLDEDSDKEGRESPSGAGPWAKHWLVSVDGLGEEVEVSERYLGRVLTNNTTPSSGRSSNARKAKKPAATSKPPPSKPAPSKAKGKASVKPAVAKVAAAPKKAAADNNNSNSDNNNDSKPKTAGTKRQRGVVDDLFEGDVGDIEKMKKNKRHKGPPAPKTQDGETVTVVHMKTGKLYLYRGLKPRAEFVWLV